MMLDTTTLEIVEVLQDTRLLNRAHFDELVQQLLPHCDDWRILGREMVYRGWLTPFQVKRLVQGRGQELILGSYVLQERLGEGGMGQVYRCRNWKLGTPAAVKVLRRKYADDPATVERFLREVRALGAIRHPHVVHALDADLQNGRLYCAMEYLPSTDLAHVLLERGALSIEKACQYAAQLADALRYISSHGLVHRDVKPANVLVSEDGSTVKLLDLGLARFEHSEPGADAGHLTQVGMMIGTPDYVSPEQIRDSRRADIRSDLYSLGCTLYHTLAGQPPFAAAAMIDKLYHHQTVEPTPVEVLRPDVPEVVAQVVRKLMAKKPRDRYQDPGEVCLVLRPYLLSGADTLTDAVNPTHPGLPLSHPDWELPRTAEIPLEKIRLIRDEKEARNPIWLQNLAKRVPWLVAAGLAGVTFALLVLH